MKSIGLHKPQIPLPRERDRNHSEGAGFRGLLGEHFAAGHYSGDLQIWGKHYEIGVCVWRDHSFFAGETEAHCGNFRGHSYGFGQAHTKRDDVPNRAVESERAACQAAFEIATHAAGDDDVKGSQLVGSVRHSRGGNSIAHQHDAFDSFCGEQKANRRIVHVDAIGDHFGCYARIGEHCAQHSCFAM